MHGNRATQWGCRERSPIQNQMVTVFSPLPEGSGAIRIHRALEFALHGYQVKGYFRYLEYLPPLLIKARLTRRLITHAPPDHAIFVAPPRVPLVITFHNYFLDPFMRQYSGLLQHMHYATDLRLYTRLALQRASCVTAVSTATAELVRNDLHYSGQIVVIPNGIDTSSFYPPQNPKKRNSIRVLFSGNLTRRKGVQWLPSIAAQSGTSAEFLVTGGLRGESALSSASNIQSIGRVAPDHMPELYRSVDMLLLPSVREGMSLAVLEAMASGLPVVATDIPEMRELIHYEKGGILCPLGNVDAFAAAVKRLASNADLRQSMAVYNRQRVIKDFTLQKMVDGYRQVFASVA